MAAFVDTLRDRWDGISPRERNLVVLLGASFVVCVIVYLALSIHVGLSALEGRNARTRRALLTLADLRARGELNASQNDTTEIPSEPVKLESYLTKAASKVGITIPSYNPRPSTTTKSGFAVHAGQVELRELTITQLKDLLEAIESDSKVVVITAMTVSRNFRDKQKVDLKLDLATYSKPSEGGAGAGSGAGSAAPGAAAGAGKGS
jgi:type II secretory pathway component PulM